MANETRERRLKETAICLTTSDGFNHLIEDRDLVDLWYFSDLTAETIVAFQQERRAAKHQSQELQKRIEEVVASEAAMAAALDGRQNQILFLCGLLGLDAEEQLASTVDRLAKCVKGLKPEEVEALGYYLRGERPCYSTGIHGGLTAGYGRLDALGYWQYPLPNVFVDAVERMLDKDSTTRMRLAANLALNEIQNWIEKDAAAGKTSGSNSARLARIEAHRERVRNA